MLPFLQDILFGKDREPSVADQEKIVQRTKLSEHLPWLTYDHDNKIYYNMDDTAGYIWECSPMAFSSENTCSILEGLLRLPLPESSIMQFILYADPYIDHVLDSYASNMVRSRDFKFIEEAVSRYKSFLLKGVDGMKAMQGVPLRNFRLIISVKVPVKASYSMTDLYNSIYEILKSASLYPEDMHPGELLDFLRKFFNDKPSLNNFHYDEDRYIRKQAIFADTVIEAGTSFLKLGERYFRCATVNSFPKRISPVQTNKIFGGYQGIIDDGNQFSSPFLYSLNIVYKKLASKLHTACSMVLSQKFAGSFAPAIARRQDEYVRAVDQIEQGVPFFYIIPSLWVWGNDYNSTSASISRAKTLWENNGYIMQEDKYILLPLLQASLPMGLYDVGHNIDILDRHHTVPADVVPYLLPIQADFSGGGRCVAPYIGRKGQLARLDIFSDRVLAYNGLIIGGTGGGKSFLVNSLCHNYFSSGAKIRLIDIGYSYEKTSWMYDAKFVDFRFDSNMCLNPFTNVSVDDPERFADDLSLISQLVLQMCYSSSSKIPDDVVETATSLIGFAVRWAWDNKENEASIDTVFEYLHTFPKYYINASMDGEHSSFINTLAKRLAFQLHKFTSDGEYGAWFNGACTLDIKKDNFVVLELQSILSKKDLFKVVTFSVLNEVTRDLYNSDKKHPVIVIFDEAHLLLESGSYFQGIIEQGFRRARKAKGSFFIITQSILDLKKFGPVGDVIWGNSPFKFFLQSPDFIKAKAENLISYGDFAMSLLKSVATNKPHYSEIFCDTPFGAGVLRLMVDDYCYYIYTSDPNENAEIKNMIATGMDKSEALAAMVSKYRAHSN